MWLRLLLYIPTAILYYIIRSFWYCLITIATETRCQGLLAQADYEAFPLMRASLHALTWHVAHPRDTPTQNLTIRYMLFKEQLSRANVDFFNLICRVVRAQTVSQHTLQGGPVSLVSEFSMVWMPWIIPTICCMQAHAYGDLHPSYRDYRVCKNRDTNGRMSVSYISPLPRILPIWEEFASFDKLCVSHFLCVCISEQRLPPPHAPWFRLSLFRFLPSPSARGETL